MLLSELTILLLINVVAVVSLAVLDRKVLHNHIERSRVLNHIMSAWIFLIVCVTWYVIIRAIVNILCTIT